jgi:hypothetical protein
MFYQGFPGFAFVHIPKCGGTSVESALLHGITGYGRLQDAPRHLLRDFWLPRPLGPGEEPLQHRKWHEFRAGAHVKSFAFVRNPWDRAVSQIRYLTAIAGPDAIHGRTFKHKLRQYCVATGTVRAQDLASDQFAYLTGVDGSIGVQKVGRFEDLAHDFEEICRWVGLPRMTLPIVNRLTDGRHYSSFFDDEGKAWIESRFARDVREWEYRFQRLERYDEVNSDGCIAAAPK